MKSSHILRIAIAALLLWEHAEARRRRAFRVMSKKIKKLEHEIEERKKNEN